MYLKRVTIENFRCIEKLTLDFQPGVNLLIGNNGVGKTSILKAIVAGMGACFKNISVAKAAQIPKEDIRQELQVVDGSPSVKYHNSACVSCHMQVGDEVYTWSRFRKDESAGARPSIEYPDDKRRIADWFRNASNDIDAMLPVLNYLSFDRVPKRSDFGSSTKQLNDRRCGYIGCLDNGLDDQFIRKWCYAMIRKRDVSPRYDLFCKAVGNIMQLIGELDGVPEIDYSEEFDEVGDFVYAENGTVMPISYLSAGYQSVLWMAMEIAFRALLLNPGTTDMKKVFGVVLIDEIDTHLHPKWQWNVLNALHDTFPNIQFIITTHAPIVISSCKNATMIAIDSNHQATPLEDSVYGYGVEDVIKYTQRSHAVIPKLRELYEQFENACAQKDLDAAQNYYDEIGKEFPNSTERAKAQTRLRFLKIGG